MHFFAYRTNMGERSENLKIKYKSVEVFSVKC